MKINPSQSINELITAISFIIDVEGTRKLYHAWRVAILASKFSPKLNSKKRKDIFYASLLHDVGAVGLTRHIIHFLKEENKRNPAILLSHPIIGAQLVSIIPQMNPVARLILDHHEWFNGSGYPRAKSNKLIPLGAQLIRVADSLDITMRLSNSLSLKVMNERLNKSANREISRNLSKSVKTILKKQRFLSVISDNHKLPNIFYETKSRIGQIRMSKGIDSIGRVLEVIAQIIDMKHPFTAGHSSRVSRFAMAIALAMKLEHDEVTYIKWAGLIHDIGKLSVPRQILDKAASLTRKEFVIVKRHPEITAKILTMVPSLKEIVPIAACHHEYFDGSGYPRGLKAGQCMRGARILTICDAFDAITSNRPYRKPLSIMRACQEIKRCAGKQFDPEIVKYSLPLFKNLSL